MMAAERDTILRNGTIYDGSGEPSYRGDVAIQGDSIAAIGDIGRAVAKNEIDVAGVGTVLDEVFIVREIKLESVVIGFVGYAPSEDTSVPLSDK